MQGRFVSEISVPGKKNIPCLILLFQQEIGRSMSVPIYGYYTAKLSELVGEKGRIIALEPVSSTFELLVSNSRHFKYSNVTLLNIGASERPGIINMEIPTFETGLKNYFEANITEKNTGVTSMVMPIDVFPISRKVKLVKIDTEGHEMFVVRGMINLIMRDYPILIIETNSSELVEYLKRLGYSSEKLDGSPNYIFRHE